MSALAHILVVDDEPDIRSLVKEILEDEGYEVSVAEDGAAARGARRLRRPDLVLLDIWMPDVDGVTLLKEWREEGSLNTPVIMMSGHGTVETAVEATRLGAYDFIEKPLSLAKLLLTVERALEADKLQRENVGLRQHVTPLTEPLGKSGVMQEIREQIRRVAQHETPVLMSGEPGSGKHVCARYLHSCSSRREGPFIEVGVTSISGDNAAAELFGEEENGRIRYGRLEQANGGSLFLYDIADMDLPTQARFATALEARSFVRAGGSEPVEVDVRIVAASKQDLEQEVQAGRFREDLFYQLNIVPLRIPPLREHHEDVPELLNYCIDHFVTNDGLPYRVFSTAAQNRLRNHSWPGNIRELKNLVQRLLIVGSGDEIGVEEIELALGDVVHEEAAGMSRSMFDMPLRQAREQFEKAYLEHQLVEAGGSVGKVAKLAGMERTHLYRKLRSLGIDPKKVVSGE